MLPGTVVRPRGNILTIEITICRWCKTICDKDKCPKCGRKVTCDPIEPRRDKDLVDMFPKTKFEFRGMKIESALEVMTNGSCGD
jgi:hypothetical protein